MASLIVARQGMIDMAVSNSIGSNVFDILIGLALPWFIATTMVRPGLTVGTFFVRFPRAKEEKKKNGIILFGV